MRRMSFCCILCMLPAVVMGSNSGAADAPNSPSNGKATSSERISTFDLKSDQQFKRSAWLDEQRPPRLDLEDYPHLPLTEVAVTKATDYQALLSEVAR